MRMRETLRDEHDAYQRLLVIELACREGIIISWPTEMAEMKKSASGE
jgi:hypothetical protein